MRTCNLRRLFPPILCCSDACMIKRLWIYAYGLLQLCNIPPPFNFWVGVQDCQGILHIPPIPCIHKFAKLCSLKLAKYGFLIPPLQKLHGYLHFCCALQWIVMFLKNAGIWIISLQNKLKLNWNSVCWREAYFSLQCAVSKNRLQSK
jgi:hypothetical protein